MEISAYSLVHAQVCAKPLSVWVTSPAGSSTPVAASYHLISNEPALTLCNRTIFDESGLACTRATITASDATLNGEAAESVAYMLLGMEWLRKLLAAHKAAAAFVSAGCAQTISTEGPASSIAVRNCEDVVAAPASDLSGSNLSMTGLLNACSAIHAASSRQRSP